MSGGTMVVLGQANSKIADHVVTRAAAAGIRVTRNEWGDGALEGVTAADVVVIADRHPGSSGESTPAAIEGSMRTGALLLICCHATSATEAASALTHPERVVGFGLLPPCEERATVELASAMQTERGAHERAVELWSTLGHEALTVGDGAGLIVARVVACLANEAAFAVMEGVATAADIDTAMRLGTGYPRGPLAWCDLVGAKNIVATLDALAAEHGDDRFRAAPLLRKMAAAGVRWGMNDDRT